MREFGVVRCSICGQSIRERDESVRLTDGSFLCQNCIRRIRILLPYQVGKDPLVMYSLAGIQSSLEKAVPYREAIVAHYLPHYAVLQVENIERMKKGLFGPTTVIVRGRVLLGRFFAFDPVFILHQGHLIGEGGVMKSEKASRSFKGLPILSIQSTTAPSFLDDKKQPILLEGEAYEGYPATLVFEGKKIELEPGDYVVKGGA